MRPSVCQLARQIITESLLLRGIGVRAAAILGPDVVAFLRLAIGPRRATWKRDLSQTLRI